MSTTQTHCRVKKSTGKTTVPKYSKRGKTMCVWEEVEMSLNEGLDESDSPSLWCKDTLAFVHNVEKERTFMHGNDSSPFTDTLIASHLRLKCVRMTLSHDRSAVFAWTKSIKRRGASRQCLKRQRLLHWAHKINTRYPFVMRWPLILILACLLFNHGRQCEDSVRIV